MSVQRVTTHVVESEPLILTFSHQHSWFVTHLTGGGIIWNHQPIPETCTTEIADLIAEADRVVLDVADYLPQERETLIQALLPWQKKVKIIIPIYSFWQLKVAGEVPNWQTAAAWQRGSILHWSSLLPDAKLIFVRDALDWRPPAAFSLLLTQHWSDHLLYAPQATVTLITKLEVLSALRAEIGSPSTNSILLQASEYSLTSLFEQAVPLYESMYRTRVEQQRVATVRLELLPFPCRVREIPTSLARSADQALSLLPAPKDEAQRKKDLQIILNQMQDDPWLAVVETESTRIVQTTAQLEPKKVPQPKSQEATQQPQQSQPSVLQPEPESQPEPPPDLGVAPTPTSDSEAELLAPPTPSTISSVEKEQQLQEDVRRLFSTQGVQQHTQTIRRKSKQRRVAKKRSRKRTVVFYLGLVFVAVGLFGAALLGSLQVTQHLVRRELLAVAEDLAEPNAAAKNSVSWGKLPLLLTIMQPQQRALDTFFSLPLLDTSRLLTTAYNQLQASLELRDKRAQGMAAIYSIATGQNPGDMAKASATLQSDLLSALTLVESLSTTTTHLPEPLSTSFASAAAQLLPSRSNRRIELVTSSLLPNTPNLTGATGVRRYAVVLQNSQELRPTGGFIEAVALLTFENGGITARDYYSGYQLDQLLDGEVKPPPDLTATLGETQWWLQDANWFADGNTAGKQVMWFLEKILEKPVDGVFFINTAGLPQLLKAMGPLEVSAFNEVLTEKNLGERLEFHNELPGEVVADRPDYRQELLKQLVLKLTSLSAEQVPTFYTTLSKLAEEKQIIFAFRNPADQQLFRQLGWTGDLTFPICPATHAATGCVTDGLALVETNIGANRANAYISRLQTHNTILTPSGAQHERKIRYTNAAKSSAWPKGDYRVYLRAYTPGKPTEITATVSGVPLDGKQISVRETEFGAEIGLLLTVPIASTEELVLRYFITEPLSPTSTYVFYENRQAGLTEPIPALTLSYPADWQVNSYLPSAVQNGSQLLFSESLATHLMRVVQFTPAQ